MTTTSSTQTTTTYRVTRDSATAWRDEDRAMCHESYGSHATLEEAKAALIEAVLKEAAYLVESANTYTCTRGKGDARANEIRSAIPAMIAAQPSDQGNWANARIEAAGLQWDITRITKEA